MEKYFNLEYLNTFLVAAETSKLNQTAELTYHSHSAVSTQIKKLENQIQTPLFIRNKNSLTLTKGGEILKNYAEQLLNTNNIAFKLLTEKTWNGTLTIGVPPDYSEYFMTNIYPNITSKLPGYNINVDFSRSRTIRTKIHERKIDIGIVAMEPQYEDDILLWEEKLAWVCSKDFNIDNYKSVPVALFSDDCIINNHSLYCLKKSKVDFKITFTSNSMDGVANCVKSGASISLLMNSQINNTMKIIPRDFLDCPFSLKMGCSWNENTDNNILNIIIECIQDKVDEYPPNRI